MLEISIERQHGGDAIGNDFAAHLTTELRDGLRCLVRRWVCTAERMPQADPADAVARAKMSSGWKRSATSNTADDPQSSEGSRYPRFFIQLGTGGVGTRAGLGATRWAGGDAGIAVETLELAA